MDNLRPVFKKLGLTSGNGLFITSEGKWKAECAFPSRVERVIENKIMPDAFFCFDNKPLILFYDSPDNVAAIHKTVWNFNESPVVIIAHFDRIEIFNGFDYIRENKQLKIIGGSDKLNNFTYFELVTGKSWEVYQENLENKNRVDYHLLNNIKTARDILINDLELEQAISNALIGKVIFVRYLIDREVKIGFNEKPRVWTNDEFCDLLSDRIRTISFFQHLEVKFNGDMFTLDDDEYETISQDCLNLLIKLLQEDEIATGQQSLFKYYDFSIIPIEFVSNVYESFIGQENQEEEGACYTPLFLVDYMLKETVDKKLSTEQNVYNCKVIDPACGSGIFLVETLRKIIERYLELNPEAEANMDEFKTTLQALAKDNIYGIDKNLSAVQVAIFSIQLTLLDYQTPSSIETFKFPKLLDSNFFEADFFDLDHKYNEILNDIEFDFILGNPPWKGSGMDEHGRMYLKKRLLREGTLGKEFPIAVNNGEIAEGFMLRVSDISSTVTQVSFIIRSTILYNLGYSSEFSKFRRYLLQEFKINKVFELAPVRKEVFDKSNDPAIAPAAIIFYSYSNGENTDDQIIEHISLKPSRFFSMFKVFTIGRNDYKIVAQKKLKQFDWLWKTLVYGAYLDFDLIKRIKESYPSLRTMIEGSEKFITGAGVAVGGGDKNDSSHLIGLPFINTRKKEVKPFSINIKASEAWSRAYIHRPRNKQLFEAPMLLIKKGVSSKFRMTTATCRTNAVYTDSLTAVKAVVSEDEKHLTVMEGIFNSSFFPYFALQCFSSIGIEREQVLDVEKYSVPYIFNQNVEERVKKIEALQESRYATDRVLHDYDLDKSIVSEIDFLDEQILELFDFNDMERSLLNYANSYTIPLIKKHPGYESVFRNIEFSDAYLSEYAQLYLNRFKPVLDTADHKFIVEIWHSDYLIGMFFRVVPNTEEFADEIVWVSKSNDEMLPRIIALSSEKITDELFVQKDMRGFEQDSFYVFKPNEKRLWHKAIGYLDVDEFMDAILRSGDEK